MFRASTCLVAVAILFGMTQLASAQVWGGHWGGHWDTHYHSVPHTTTHFDAIPHGGHIDFVPHTTTHFDLVPHTTWHGSGWHGSFGFGSTWHGGGWGGGFRSPGCHGHGGYYPY